MSALWLVGMPGSGKTTVGRIVAEILGETFLDTDSMVEQLASASVAEVWESHGESGFRELEEKVFDGLSGTTGIVATGGGSLGRAENLAMITGTVVWLEATPETLAGRLEGQGQRPLLLGSSLDRLTQLLEERRTTYERIADHRVSTDAREPEDIADEVVAIWAN